MAESSTYQLNADDVPVLGIILKVGIVHQPVVFQDGDPVLIVFHFFFHVWGVCRSDELLDCDGKSVEVLQSQVSEEGDLVVLVEADVNVVLARPLLLGARLIWNGDVRLLDRILILHQHVAYSCRPYIHSLFRFQLLTSNSPSLSISGVLGFWGFGVLSKEVFS